MGKKRNYGIDLLRIISMFYVVLLHCLLQGGVLNNPDIGTIQYKIAWFMEIWAYCAVNLFALISGFVGYTEKEKKYNYSSYIVMWLQVVSYGIVVSLFFFLLKPELFNIKDLIVMFFPVTNNLYWYFTAYTGLFFLIPILNAGVRNCEEKLLKKTLVVIFIIYICFDNTVNRFCMMKGYSFIWLVILYLMGAIIKKCKIGENLKTSVCMLGIFIMSFITWIWKMYGIETEFYNGIINKNLLISYTSPTIVVIAVLYVIGFSKLKFNDKIESVIKFLAPGTFAVYILNNHKYIWMYVMTDRFSKLAIMNPFALIGVVIGFSFLFVMISICIDKLRIIIFDKLKIKVIVKKLLREK